MIERSCLPKSAEVAKSKFIIIQLKKRQNSDFKLITTDFIFSQKPMNQLITIQNEFSSFTGSIQSIMQQTSKGYHIQLKRQSFDQQLIEKQTLMITKLKTQNTLLKGYLSKAYNELKQIRLINKNPLKPQNPSQQLKLMQQLNTELKRQLQDLQSEMATVKDKYQRERYELEQKVSDLRRELEENLDSFGTLHYEAKKKEEDLNQKEKEIWELQASIAELTEANYQKQSFIDKFKVLEDERMVREDFRYLGSGIKPHSGNNLSRKSDDILIQGEEFIVTSELQPIQKTQTSCQTQTYEVFQFSNRAMDRNTPSKRKNHHMSPEADKDQKIRQYARQLTQKQKQCITQEKQLDAMKKDNKKLDEKLKEKEKQLKREIRRVKRLKKKLQNSSIVKEDSEVDSSDLDDELDQDNLSSQKNIQKEQVNEQIICHEVQIQTDEMRMQNPYISQNSPKQKPPIQKVQSRQSLNDQSFEPTSKKEKRRKNRTIEHDHEDGRQKLKSLMQELQKKEYQLSKLEADNAHSREVLNETRNKLRKKENQCKKLAKQLKGFKSGISDGVQYSEINLDDEYVQVICHEVEVQTEQIRVNQDEGEKKASKKAKRKNFESQQLIRAKNPPDTNQPTQTQFSKNQPSQNNFQQSYQQSQSHSVKDSQIQSKQQLKLLIPSSSPQKHQVVSPRSQSYSHKQEGERIVNIQKLQKQNQYLKQENTSLKYQLQEFKRNWIQGLKNIQRQYCSESGSDFHSERDIIGALSDREMLPRKFRERIQEEHYVHYNRAEEKIQCYNVQTQTQDIEEELDDEINELEKRKSSRIIDEKSQKSKSQAKSDNLHLSKSQLQVSSQAQFQYRNELKPQHEKQSKRKKIRHHLNVQQQKLKQKIRQNQELKRQLKQISSILAQSKKTEQQLRGQLRNINETNSGAEKGQKVKILQSNQMESLNLSNEENLLSNDDRIVQVTNQKSESLNVVTYQDAEMQTEDADVEISCIEKRPILNDQLSLRNDNLFDLQQIMSADVQTQTQDIEKSILHYRSFDNKNTDGFAKTQEKIYDEAQMPECQKTLKNENLDQNNAEKPIISIEQVEKAINEVPSQEARLQTTQLLNEKLHQMTEQIIYLTQQLQLEKAKSRNKSHEDKIQQKEKSGVEIHEKSEDSSPSYMQDSSILESKKNTSEKEVQTQEMSYSLSLAKIQSITKDQCNLVAQREIKISDYLQNNRRESQILTKFNQQRKVLMESKQKSSNSNKSSGNSIKLTYDYFADSLSQQGSSSTQNQHKSEKLPRIEKPEKAVERSEQVKIDSDKNLKAPVVHLQFKLTGSRILEEEKNEEDDYQQPLPRSNTDNQSKEKDRISNGSIVDIYIENEINPGFRYGIPNLIGLSREREEIGLSQPTQRVHFAPQVDHELYISQQMTYQINMYKQELILTQQQNFDLEKTVHDVNLSLNSLKEELQLLKLQMNKKDQQLLQKQNQIQSNRTLLIKLKSQRDEIIRSLDRYVDDSSEGNSPDRRQALIEFWKSEKKEDQDQIVEKYQNEKKNQQKQFVALKFEESGEKKQNENVQKGLIKQGQTEENNAKDIQNYEIKQEIETVKAKTQEPAQFEVNTEPQQPNNKQQNLLPQNLQQTTHPSQAQSQLHQTTLTTDSIMLTTESQPPKLDAYKVSLSDREMQTQCNEILSLNLSQSIGVNEIYESGFTKKVFQQYADQQAVQAQPQSAIQIVHSSISNGPALLEESPKKTLPGEHHQEHTHGEHKHHRIAHQDHRDDFMIHQTQSQILRCTQCVNYSMKIKELQQHILRLNADVDELSNEIKKNEEIDSKEKLLQSETKNLIFIDQIDVVPYVNQNVEDGQIAEIKTTQIVIKEDDKEDVLASSLEKFKNQKLVQSRVTEERLEEIFTIQNIQNLPFIYYDLQQDAPNLEEKLYESNLRKSNSKKTLPIESQRLDLKQDDKIIEEEAKKEIEELFEPGLILKQKQSGNIDTLIQADIAQQRIMNDQQCQTEEIIESAQPKVIQIYQKLSQQATNQEKHIPQETKPQIPLISQFPILFISHSPVEETLPKLQDPAFNPIFVSQSFDKQSKFLPSTTEFNQLLLENFLLQQQSSQQAVTQQLTFLSLKVYEWISKIRNALESKLKIEEKEKKNVQEKQDDFLLEEDNVQEDHHEENNEKAQKIVSFDQTIQQIVKALGPSFLYLQKDDLVLSQQEFAQVTLEIQNKYLQLQSQSSKY